MHQFRENAGRSHGAAQVQNKQADSPGAALAPGARDALSAAETYRGGTAVLENPAGAFQLEKLKRCVCFGTPLCLPPKLSASSACRAYRSQPYLRLVAYSSPPGFTIPLDKRMAADMRGKQDVTINDNFAKFSEALYIAERESRKEIQMRQEIQKKAAQKEKERKEQSLRNLAARAREERAGIRHFPAGGDEGDDTAAGADSGAAAGAGAGEGGRPVGRGRSRTPSSESSGSESDSDNAGSDDAARRRRDEIRRDRARERTRERNIARAAPDKRNRLQRDKERDVSERVALGLPAANTGGAGGGYDARLFGQSRGIGSGFGDESDYNVYDKPMRGEQATSIYRPTRAKEDNAEEEYERIVSWGRGQTVVGGGRERGREYRCWR